jgi:hypothetical protein
VCAEGRRLYKPVRHVFEQLERIDDEGSPKQQELLEQWYPAADAYLAHIGRVVHRDRLA